MVPDYCEDAGGSLSRRSKKWHVFGAIRSDELGRGMLRTGRYHDKQIRLSGKLFESRRSPQITTQRHFHSWVIRFEDLLHLPRRTFGERVNGDGH